MSGRRSPDTCSAAGRAPQRARCSCERSRRRWGWAAVPCRRSSGARARGPGWHRSEPTGCGTPQPATCCAPAGRWPRSVRFFGMTRLAPRRSMPGSMSNGCARSRGPGLPERRHERAGRALGGLPADAPRTGLPARALSRAAAGVPRLPGGRRREHGHRRAGGGLGVAARRDQTDHGKLPAQHGARLRPLPARDRPLARGSATRPARGAAAATGALPVFTRRPGPDAGDDPAAAAPAARSGLRDAVRPACRCGLRIGEALALPGDDVDLDDGVLTIRHAKFDRMRLVPLHPSVTAALRDYAAVRDQFCPARRTDRFFVSATGCALQRREAERVFHAITIRLGLRTGAARPRVHDLRHTFAVHTLTGWQREGADIPALLPVLPAYLGHVEPANTYWYLSATSKLMQPAAARPGQHFGGRP